MYFLYLLMSYTTCSEGGRWLKKMINTTSFLWLKTRETIPNGLYRSLPASQLIVYSNLLISEPSTGLFYSILRNQGVLGQHSLLHNHRRYTHSKRCTGNCDSTTTVTPIWLHITNTMSRWHWFVLASCQLICNVIQVSCHNYKYLPHKWRTSMRHPQSFTHLNTHPPPPAPHPPPTHPCLPLPAPPAPTHKLSIHRWLFILLLSFSHIRYFSDAGISFFYRF